MPDALAEIFAELVALLPLMLLAWALVVIAGVAVIVHTGLRPATKGLGWCLGRGEPTCPGDLHTTGRERTLPLNGNHSTTAWDLAGHQPDGPCLLFIHGHSGSRYHALAKIAPLLPHTQRILALNLPGHGDATAKRCTLGVREPDDLAAVLTFLLDELKAQAHPRPAPPLIVMAESMGAQSALAAVARPPLRHRVAGLITVGVYHRFADPFRGHADRRALPRWMFVPPTVAAYRLILGPGIAFDRTADAQQLACPLLLLHGEHDAICPLALAQHLHDVATAAGVKSELITFPAGGHTQLHHTHPDLYAQSLARFLQQCRNTPLQLLTPDI